MDVDAKIILDGISAARLIAAITEVVKIELGKSEPEELMTREEAAEFLKVNISTLSKWTSEGRLKGYGVAGRRYYKKSEIMSALEVVKF